MTTQPIRFFHRGQVVEVAGVHPTRSVLDWLRIDAACSGTKEGCNEGDCGACTVVVGELADDDTLRLQTVNACIRFLPSLDGCALFTVEDLKSLGSGALHPVQQALVDCHGSQCGFCTPGFVMSLWAAYEHHPPGTPSPTRQQLADELSGNLCRCTGYRPILDAGERMFTLPPVRLDTAAIVAALRPLQRDIGLHYAGPSSHDAGRADRFDAPRTVDDLATLFEARPTARLLGGSTDIGLWVNKQFRDVGDLIAIGRVAELKRLEATADGLYIGAAVSLEDAWSALAVRHPALTDVWLRFASPPIRHAGTMGGNVANGSPIGDAPPVLMALDADIELRRGARVRRMPLHTFYTGYMANQLEPGEFVTGLVVPDTTATVRAYKVSKRFDSDISALCAGLAIGLAADGTVAHVRIAFGGMAATVRRAVATEAAMRGQPWSEATVRAAQQALAAEFTPLSDLRASDTYRRQVAQNLLMRFWFETRADGPLAPNATSVFASMRTVPIVAVPESLA